MPSTVEQLSPTRVKITVEVPFADLKPSLDKAYANIARSINVPGFRRGKVPAMVIDQRFGRGVVLQEALNDSIQGFYGAAVNENNLTPLAQPDLEVTKLEDGDLIEFTAEVDVRPEFTLPELDALTASVDALDVPDALIDEQISVLRRRFGSRESVERAAAAGDVVTINLVASRDNETLPDANAEGLEYTVGSGDMLEGLDDAVIGLSAGESARFSSTLVGGPLKDEPADVEVEVTAVQSEELPAVDDDLAQQASEFDTIGELRADITERLTRMARLEQASQARDAVLEGLVAQTEVDVPENILAGEIEARRQGITDQLAQAQLSLEDYLTNSEDGKSEEEFWADIEGRSGDALKAQLILDKLADDRELSADQNDLTQHIIRRAQQDRVPPQQVANHLQEHPHHIQEYMTEIRRAKALALLVESATVTDSNGERVDLVNLQEDGSFVSAEDELGPEEDVSPENGSDVEAGTSESDPETRQDSSAV